MNPGEMRKRPAVAELGNLRSAEALLNQGDAEGAWAQALEAIRTRPFHPEALLMMGKIALKANDTVTAGRCRARAASLVPGWREVQDFAPAKGQARAPREWPGLAALLEASQAETLSVCLIVKDEEAFLARCLKSVRPLAAQIVVVDTGSSDRSVAIARAYGAEVHPYEWQDDFAAARNESLAHARGDWILCLDADEELAAGAQAQLTEELKDHGSLGYYLPLINVGREGEGFTLLGRLFRNLPGASFEGRVHEQVFGTVIARAKAWGLEVRSSRARLLHYGYTADLTARRGKVARNLRLLRQAIAEPEADPLMQANMWMNLGLETVRSGHLAEGIGYYRQALDLLNQQPQVRARASPEFRGTLARQLSTHLITAGRFEDVLSLFATPLLGQAEWTASDQYALGLASLRAGRFEKAVGHLRQCLAERAQPNLIPINPGIMGAGPYCCLALALAGLKRWAEAEAACDQGLAQLPNALELHLLSARFKFQQGRAAEAVNRLKDLRKVKEWLQDPELWILGGEIGLSQPQFYAFAADWTAEACHWHPANGQIAAQAARARSLVSRPNEQVASE